MGVLGVLGVGAAVLLSGGGEGGSAVPAADTVARIEAGSTAFAESVPVGVDPVGVAVGEDGDLWVINQGDSTVSRIDAESGEVVLTKMALK